MNAFTENLKSEYFDLFGLNYKDLLTNNRSLHDSYKIKLNNIIFLSDTTNKLNGAIYEKTADEDIGDEIGVFKDGKAVFHKKK